MALFDMLKKQAENALKKTVREVAGKAEKSAEKAVRDMALDRKKFTFDSLPSNLAELKARPEADLKDPYAVAALTVCALNVFTTDRDACFEMLDYLKGPSPLTPSEKQFINDRFMDGKTYIALSYFEGAAVDNNYQPAVPYSITVKEGAHSRDQIKEGYITLFLTSGGADAERMIKLRTKPSTGEWFAWEFSGVLSSIRVPKADNPWA